MSSLTRLVTGSETGGGYGLFRVDFGKGNGGTGNHFHRTFHEDILVLSGSMALFDGRAPAKSSRDLVGGQRSEDITGVMA